MRKTKRENKHKAVDVTRSTSVGKRGLQQETTRERGGRRQKLSKRIQELRVWGHRVSVCV